MAIIFSQYNCWGNDLQAVGINESGIVSQVLQWNLVAQWVLLLGQEHQLQNGLVSVLVSCMQVIYVWKFGALCLFSMAVSRQCTISRWPALPLDFSSCLKKPWQALWSDLLSMASYIRSHAWFSIQIWMSRTNCLLCIESRWNDFNMCTSLGPPHMTERPGFTRLNRLSYLIWGVLRTLISAYLLLLLFYMCMCVCMCVQSMDIRDLFRKQAERNEEKQRSKTRVSCLFSLGSEGCGHSNNNECFIVFYSIVTVLGLC